MHQEKYVAAEAMYRDTLEHTKPAPKDGINRVADDAGLDRHRCPW